MARRYQMKRREKLQEETRRRIVEAAMALHGAQGIAGTTVTEIAERAGVGRQTVYRHFPDELALLRACSGHYWEQHPWPDPEPWGRIADPEARLRAALEETYAYHRRTEGMTAMALAEAPDSPIMRPYFEHWEAAADLIASAWQASGPAGVLLRGAVGHALAFTTWQSLVRGQGLSDEEAEGLMRCFVAHCAAAG